MGCCGWCVVISVALLSAVIGLVPFALKQGTKADTRGFAVVIDMPRASFAQVLPTYLHLPDTTKDTHPLVLLFQYMHEEQPIPKYLAGPPFPLTYYELIVGVPSLTLSHPAQPSTLSGSTYFWNLAMYVNETVPDLFGRMLGFPKRQAKFANTGAASGMDNSLDTLTDRMQCWAERDWSAGVDAPFNRRFYSALDPNDQSYGISGAFAKANDGSSTVGRDVSEQATQLALEGTWLISTLQLQHTPDEKYLDPDPTHSYTVALLGEINWDWGFADRQSKVWPVEAAVSLRWEASDPLSVFNGNYTVSPLSAANGRGAFYYDASWFSYGSFFFFY
eukprot:TRINITY_DN4284_c0_g1_i1.p1 TRINITY_DN4284_c0_g1~~TRINITY_DN4284_c0_g1_i1.p1  ORF type:complete len:333 (-),score=44.26 TRINITY_DN4284_c0_g1_i1:53-1051(-)